MRQIFWIRSNPLTSNGGGIVHDAFMRKYGLDLKKNSGGSLMSLGSYLEIKKINS